MWCNTILYINDQNITKKIEINKISMFLTFLTIMGKPTILFLMGYAA